MTRLGNIGQDLDAPYSQHRSTSAKLNQCSGANLGGTFYALAIQERAKSRIRIKHETLATFRSKLAVTTRHHGPRNPVKNDVALLVVATDLDHGQSELVLTRSTQTAFFSHDQFHISPLPSYYNKNKQRSPPVWMVLNEGDIATRMGGDLVLGRVYLCQPLVLAESYKDIAPAPFLIGLVV